MGKIKLLIHNCSNNLLLSYFSLFLLATKAFLSNEHFIYIKVNKVGYNQILSNEYIGTLPSKLFVNEKLAYLNNKKLYINSTNDQIILQWDNTLSNFSFMFSNLNNIANVFLSNIVGYVSNMSYMFKNCYNLKYFNYSIDYNTHSIINMTGMFYNCLSLNYFDFYNLNLTGEFDDEQNNKYYGTNMSYMFIIAKI